MVYALLNPATGELSYANAGHPPPVWAAASGRAGYLDGASGVMLGAPIEPEFTVGHQTLEPGTSLMFYTDGLIEDRSRDISDGLSALADVMSGVMGGPAPLSAERTCAAVQGALLGDTPRSDDVCLLGVRLTGLRRRQAGRQAGRQAAPRLAGGRSGGAEESGISAGGPARAGPDLPERLHPRYEA